MIPEPRMRGVRRQLASSGGAGWNTVLLAAGGEHVRTDLPDSVIQILESFADPLPRHAVGKIDGGLQVQADTEQAADDLVEQFRAALRVLGRSRADEAGEVSALGGSG